MTDTTATLTIDPTTGRTAWIDCPACGRQPAILKVSARPGRDTFSNYHGRCPACSNRVHISKVRFARIGKAACGPICEDAHPGSRCTCSCGGRNHGKKGH